MQRRNGKLYEPILFKDGEIWFLEKGIVNYIKLVSFFFILYVAMYIFELGLRYGPR